MDHHQYSDPPSPVNVLQTRWICGQTEEAFSILTNHLVHKVGGGTRTQEYMGGGEVVFFIKTRVNSHQVPVNKGRKHAQTIMSSVMEI